MPLAKRCRSNTRELGLCLPAQQQRVDAEIAYDPSQSEPMLRLVQGDVGLVKPVAAFAALQVWRYRRR
jgi:ATP-dependent DNA helicase RecG